MSERQSEWFLTDKRLIFACNNFADFKSWITKIEDLIQEATIPPSAAGSQFNILNEQQNTMMNNIRLFSNESPNKSIASIPMFT